MPDIVCTECGSPCSDCGDWDGTRCEWCDTVVCYDCATEYEVDDPPEESVYLCPDCAQQQVALQAATGSE